MISQATSIVPQRSTDSMQAQNSQRQLDGLLKGSVTHQQQQQGSSEPGSSAAQQPAHLPPKASVLLQQQPQQQDTGSEPEDSPVQQPVQASPKGFVQQQRERLEAASREASPQQPLKAEPPRKLRLHRELEAAIRQAEQAPEQPEHAQQQQQHQQQLNVPQPVSQHAEPALEDEPAEPPRRLRLHGELEAAIRQAKQASSVRPAGPVVFLDQVGLQLLCYDCSDGCSRWAHKAAGSSPHADCPAAGETASACNEPQKVPRSLTELQPAPP